MTNRKGVGQKLNASLLKHSCHAYHDNFIIDLNITRLPKYLGLLCSQAEFGKHVSTSFLLPPAANKP